MRHRHLATLIPLALCIAFTPVQAAVAADPSTQDEATAEDAHWLAAVSPGKLATNGTSLSGRIQDAERRGRVVRNGTSLSGRIEGADRRGRIVRNGTSLSGRIEGADRRGRLAGNGTSLSGWVESAVRRGKIARNGRNLNGHKLNGDGGMTVVSMELPGGARHAK